MSLELPTRASIEHEALAGETVVSAEAVRGVGVTATIGAHEFSFDDFNGNKSSMFDSGTSGFNQDEDKVGRKEE